MDSIKRWVVCGAAIVILTLVSPLAAQTATLDDMLKLAAVQNGQIRAAEREMAAAQIASQKVWSMVLSKVELQGAYRRTDQAIQRYEQTIVPKEQSAAQLVFDQPLWNPEFFPRHAESKGIAQMALEAFRHEAQTVLLKVAEAYVEVLRLKNLVDQARKAKTAAEENHQRIQAMAKAGTVTQDVVLQAELALNGASLMVPEREAELKIAQRRLSTLVSMDTHEINLEPPSELPELRGNPPEFIATALDHRSDYKITNLEVERSKNAYRAVVAQFLPTLSGRFSMTAIDRPRYDEQEEFWTASLVLNVPLIERGVRWYDLRYSREMMHRALLQESNKREAVSLEVHEAFVAAEKALKLVPFHEQKFRLSETRYRFVQTMMEKGTAVEAELARAFSEMNTAEVEMINARYNFWIEFLRLQAASGTFAKEHLTSLVQKLRASIGSGR